MNRKEILMLVLILILIPLTIGCVQKEEKKEGVKEVKLSSEPKIFVFESDSHWKANILMALPTPCHKLEYIGKQVRGNEYYLDFTYKEPENPCAQVITNYNRTIDLGELKKGEYTLILRFNGQVVKKATFKVQ